MGIRWRWAVVAVCWEGGWAGLEDRYAAPGREGQFARGSDDGDAWADGAGEVVGAERVGDANDANARGACGGDPLGRVLKGDARGGVKAEELGRAGVACGVGLGLGDVVGGDERVEGPRGVGWAAAEHAREYAEDLASCGARADGDA